MALMASKSNAFVDSHSRLELKTCVKYLWIPTLIVWLLNIFVLMIYYRLTKYKSHRIVSKNITNDIPIMKNDNQGKLSRFTGRFQPRQLAETTRQVSSIQMVVNRSISIPSFSSTDEQLNEDEISFQPSQSLFFKTILFITLIIVIVILFASSDKFHGDIGMTKIQQEL